MIELIKAYYGTGPGIHHILIALVLPAFIVGHSVLLYCWNYLNDNKNGKKHFKFLEKLPWIAYGPCGGIVDTMFNCFFSACVGMMVALTLPYLLIVSTLASLAYSILRFMRFVVRIGKGLNKVAKVAHIHKNGCMEECAIDKARF
jgi:hypothetical protein